VLVVGCQETAPTKVPEAKKTSFPRFTAIPRTSYFLLRTYFFRSFTFKKGGNPKN